MKYFNLFVGTLANCIAIFVTSGVACSSFAKNLSFVQSKTSRTAVAKSSSQTGVTSGSLKKDHALLNQRNWEFRTAPIAFIASWVTLDVSYRISEQWATGPAVILYNSEGPGGMLVPAFKGYAIGWNGNYYFSSVRKNTWYMSAHGYYESYKSYPHAHEGFKEVGGYRANSAIGYQWKWSRVNLMTGFGIEARNQNVADKREPLSDTEKLPIESRNSSWLPYLEFKMGIEI